VDVALAVEVVALDDDDRAAVVTDEVADLLEHRAVAAGQRIEEVRDRFALDGDTIRQHVVADRQRFEPRCDLLALREVAGDRRFQLALVGDDLDLVSAGAGVGNDFVVGVVGAVGILAVCVAAVDSVDVALGGLFIPGLVCLAFVLGFAEIR